MFHLKLEISNELIIDKLKDHIKVKRRVMILGGIPTELNMLNKDERLQKIEIILLWNRFRTHRYNRYHATVSDKNKIKKIITRQDTEKEDNMKAPILEVKLENLLKIPAFQKGLQKKQERNDKGMKKGNPINTINWPKLGLKCELLTFKAITQKRSGINKKSVSASLC